MDEKHLFKVLETASREAEKKDRRIDIYIGAMKRFLQHSDEWSPEHAKVFEEMLKETHGARFFRALFLSACVLIVVATASFIGYKVITSDKMKADNALLELARSATLPLKLINLEEADDFVSVKITPEFQDLPEDQEKKLRTIIDKFPSLGRHYFLGRNKELCAALLGGTSPTWQIYPKPGKETEALGKLELVTKVGKIQPLEKMETSIAARQQFTLNTPVQYLCGSEGMDFYIKISRYDKDIERWQVCFLEGNPDEGKWSQEFYHPKTNDGLIGNEPLIVYKDDWKSVYIVSLGIGKPGADEPIQERVDYAWFLRSYAMRVGFRDY